MTRKLNLKTDMEELDKLGETIESALTEKYGDGEEGVTGRSSVNNAGNCSVPLSRDVYERLFRLAHERDVSIDELLTLALDILQHES
jgi:hypothetical protein